MFSQDTNNNDVPTNAITALADCQAELQKAKHEADVNWDLVSQWNDAVNEFLHEVKDHCDLREISSYKTLVSLGCDNVIETEYLVEGSVVVEFTARIRSSETWEDVEQLVKDELDSLDLGHEVYINLRDGAYWELDDFDTDNASIDVSVQEN